MFFGNEDDFFIRNISVCVGFKDFFFFYVIWWSQRILLLDNTEVEIMATYTIGILGSMFLDEMILRTEK